MGANASGNPSAFNPKTVLALLVFGAAAFVATLYFIGAGETGRNANNGGSHAAAKGLNGYAALARLIEESGHETVLSRSPGKFDEYGLLVLTPPIGADPEAISKILEDRRYLGPTLVILPKWFAFQASQISGQISGDGEKKGWVTLVSSTSPDWAVALDPPYALDLASAEAADGPAMSWTGLNRTGALPDPRYLSGRGPALQPLIRSGDGGILAGYVDDEGYYPGLVEAAGFDPGDSEYRDTDRWNVTFVIEPDLVNNFGLSDRTRAAAAHALIDAAMEGEDLPVIFDLTLNGLGQSKNLLTLAFTAPFLAATLCLMLAMIVIAWRAFRRFGPAVAEERPIAFGKARLVRNSAGFIQRSRRLHLLTAPYTDMVRTRITRALALRHPDDDAIDRALARRAPDAPSFSRSAATLRAASTPQEILRAAAALRSIERMISK